MSSLVVVNRIEDRVNSKDQSTFKVAIVATKNPIMARTMNGSMTFMRPEIGVPVRDEAIPEPGFEYEAQIVRVPAKPYPYTFKNDKGNEQTVMLDFTWDIIQQGEHIERYVGKRYSAPQASAPSLEEIAAKAESSASSQSILEPEEQLETAESK